MTGEGIEPPLFLFVRQAPYLLGDPADMRETRLELAMPVWKTGVIPCFTTLANLKEPSPRRESNPLPQMYKTCARPFELLRQSGDSGRTRTCDLLFRRQAL